MAAANRAFPLALGLLAALAPPSSGQTPSFDLELEAASVWQNRNTVEVPNDGTATRFSLSELAGVGPAAAGRVYLTWNISDRHGIRLLYAPLSLTDDGRPGDALDFAGASYTAGTAVRATYTFNSYRASYRWRAHSRGGLSAWLGFTAKVRDATIALSQGATASRKDDLGFVPLLHLAGEWRPGERWGLTLDADGLAGGPGRAVDAALKVSLEASDRWSVRLGYRTVEGGADVDEVYAFAWLNYAVASVSWRW